MNTHLRKKAKNDFEKDLFNLMNNVVFGKTLKMWENIGIWENITCHNKKKKELFSIRTKLSY